MNSSEGTPRIHHHTHHAGHHLSLPGNFIHKMAAWHNFWEDILYSWGWQNLTCSHYWEHVIEPATYHSAAICPKIAPWEALWLLPLLFPASLWNYEWNTWTMHSKIAFWEAASNLQLETSVLMESSRVQIYLNESSNISPTSISWEDFGNSTFRGWNKVCSWGFQVSAKDSLIFIACSGWWKNESQALMNRLWNRF